MKKKKKEVSVMDLIEEIEDKLVELKDKVNEKDFMSNYDDEFDDENTD